MSIQSESLFNNSELSLAAYANLSIGATDADELKAIGMSDSEATQFATRYSSVVDVYSDSSSKRCRRDLFLNSYVSHDE